MVFLPSSKMLHFLRPIPLFSLFSMNNPCGTAKLCSIELIAQRIKLRQFYVTLPCRTQKCMSLFAQKQKWDEISQSCSEASLGSSRSSRIIKTLSKMFQCSEEEVNTLLMSYNLDSQQEIQIHDLENRFETLEKYGIEKITVKENIRIIFFNSCLKVNPSKTTFVLFETSQAKVRRQVSPNILFGDSILEESDRVKYLGAHIDSCFLWDVEVNEVANKISKGLFVLRSFSHLGNIHLSKCNEKEACNHFLKYSFMLTIHLEGFKKVLELTRDVGVLKEDLLSDPWIFRYSEKVIANRIQFLDAINAKEKCKVIKPWMLRCVQSIVNRYFELRDENIAALGSYSNIKDLLCNELELNETEVEEMFAKHPPLAKISYSKAKEMIDFLKSEGFGSKMIHQVPRVLCHKQATLVARMLELKKVNPRMMSLQNLCRNKKDYLAFLKKVKSPHS